MTQYTSQLANSISNFNLDVHVITPKCTNENVNYFNENISFNYVPQIKKLLSLNSFRFDIFIKCIFDINPDIIHITMEHPWLIPYLLVFENKCPIVSTIHDSKKHPGDWSPYPYLISLKLLKKKSSRIIVHSKAVKNQLLTEGIPEKKINVIPHGAHSFFSKYCIKDVAEENWILFFGRIVDYKGIEYLIKAEPLITNQFPNTKIVIAGNGDVSKYKNFISNKEKFIFINEYISDEMTAQLFTKSKLVVLPYIEASQSGIIPIAYSFKKPVITTQVGGLPEVVKDGITGYVVPPRNYELLANAIINLLGNDQLRVKMGENAYIFMNENLSWDQIAYNILDVYKSALNQK
ncbi:glycosyl transferase group 1 [Methanosarcina vacuolata Z-761]|uniref:Glycosyl transferase group 1 n=2 Tax=Methanosarcina vacuolata TaxID=2215 RepID=A0A0E3Q472_9EURY|nr:glycosyl transferase group 1 [Methanosarcina vacuolata Z-761]